MADLGRYADPERREPDRPARPELRTRAERLQDSRHDTERERDLAAGDAEYCAEPDSDVRSDAESGAAPVHQSGLLLVPDTDRPERSDDATGHLRAGLLQRGSRAVQELPGGRAQETAIADGRV